MHAQNGSLHYASPACQHTRLAAVQQGSRCCWQLPASSVVVATVVVLLQRPETCNVSYIGHMCWVKKQWSVAEGFVVSESWA